MPPWLPAALDYVPRWIEFQRALWGQPGVSLALAHGGEIALEAAFGSADLATGEALTPRHRIRAASHSKSFTATLVMRLREEGRLGLDDAIGRHVEGLHESVARATIGQLLSHAGGIVRDGPDAGQFMDRRPYLSTAELKADLTRPMPIEPVTRMKYSNHGFALLGLAIERVSGEPWAEVLRKRLLAPLGLSETVPDAVKMPPGTPFARGHTGALPLGRRLVVPADNATNGIAAAGGVVSTPADLARFFSRLSPSAADSPLSPASRREMTHRHWRVNEAAQERHYGLGIVSGAPGPWEYFGHSGGFQGQITRTAVLARHDIAVSVATNAADGFAHPWVDGIVHILRTFAEGGAPTPAASAWNGRWWSLWGATDLVAVGDKVRAALPAQMQPFLDAAEITPAGPERGTISEAGGFDKFGEPARRDGGSLWLGGMELKQEAAIAAELMGRYAG